MMGMNIGYLTAGRLKSIPALQRVNGAYSVTVARKFVALQV